MFLPGFCGILIMNFRIHLTDFRHLFFSRLRHFAAYTHSFDIFQFKSNKCVHCARMLWVSYCPPNICFLLKVIYLYDVRVSALVIDAKRINYSITKRRYRAYCPFQFFNTLAKTILCAGIFESYLNCCNIFTRWFVCIQSYSKR